MLRLTTASAASWRASRLDRQRLDRLRAARLDAELGSAWESTTFHRSRWGGSRPPGHRDLVDLPITTKSDLQEAGPTGLSRRWPAAVVDHTSGTTGQPLAVHHRAQDAAYLGAVWMRSHAAYGLRPWHSTGYFKNFADPMTLAERLGFYRSHHLDIGADDQTIVDRLRELQPACLGGYPSHLAELIGRIPTDELARLDVRFVATGAEELSRPLRQRIETTFGATVADLYGTTELGCIAYQCRAGTRHINEDAVLVEVIDRNGEPVADGEEGELVMTGLRSVAMPFIRYRIGDRGAIDTEPCPCRSPFARLATLTGRGDDAIVTPDGRRLNGTALCAHLRQVTDVRQYQIRQPAPDTVTVDLVIDGDPATTTTTVRNLLGDQLGPSCALKVVCVDRITRTAGGKIPDVVPLAT